MEGYHHPTYKSANLLFTSNNYDYVIFTDEDGVARYYEEYHFEGFISSAKALAAGRFVDDYVLQL